MSYRLELISLEGRNAFSYKHFKLPLHNQGLVALRGANGSGKCVTGNTLIYTTKGIIPIEDLINSKQQGFAPLKIDLATIRGVDTTTKSYREIVHSLVSIETRAGFSLEGTKEHPLLSIARSGEIKFRTLEELRIGDFVAIQRMSNTWSSTDFKIECKYTPIKCPKVMNRDLSWLFGALVAIGYTHSNFLIYKANNKALLKKVESIFIRYFPRDLLTNNSKEIRINVEQMSPFFKSCGLLLGKKEVPFSVLKSTKKVVISFLDGYVRSAVDRKQLLSTSGKLITQLHLILQNLGIICRKRRWYLKNDKKTYWALEFNRRFLKNFLRASKNNLELTADYDENLFRSICRAPLTNKQDITSNVYWDCIVARKRISKIAPVCDVVVQDNNPTFIANGFISHNSSIFSLLDNTLYSTTARGLLYKDLINVHSNNKNYYVNLKFRLDNVEYSVKSYREHEKYGTRTDVWRGGELITKHLGRNEVKAYIPQLIELDRTSFLSTVYLSQEHQHILVSGTPKEKERYLMWLFNLYRYEKLAQQCSLEKSKLDKLVDGNYDRQKELKCLKEQINTLPTPSSLKSKISKTRQKKLDLRAEIDVLDKRLTDLNDLQIKINLRQKLIDELSLIQLEDNPTNSDILRLEKEVYDLHTKVATLKKDLDQATRAKQIKKELESVQTTRPISQLRRESEQISAEKTILTKIELPGAEKAKKLRKELSALSKPTKSIEDLEEEESKKKLAVRKSEKRIATLHTTIKKGVCPTCKRPWELSIEQITALKNELEVERNALEVKNRELFKLTANIRNATSYEEINKKLKGLPNGDPDTIKEAIRANIRKGKQLTAELAIADRRNRLKAIVMECPSEKPEVIAQELNKSKVSLKEKRALLSASQKAKEILDRLADLPIDDNDTVIKDKEKVKKALTSNRRKLEKAIKIAEKAKFKLKEVNSLLKKEKDLSSSIRRHRRIKVDAELWNSLKDCFNALLRKRERELLQQLTAVIPKYTQPLFGLHSKWLVPELVKNDTGIDLNLISKGKLLPKKGISPGQRSKLGLASIFGLRDIYNSGCNLLVLDEPLVWIDEDGKNGFVDIINQLKKEIGTIILIDHGSEIKGIDFDHIWEASIDGGVSTIKTG